ncbi:MAG: PDDEXK nuclease domain-containing protein [Candidatus Dependentiae bacterium]|nr:PDDEXK nuclease domain-containing protein [Candidatus Dependentiae bacterium]
MIKKIKKIVEIKISSKEYALALKSILEQIHKAQFEAVVGVNQVLNNLYWSIGKTIAIKQKENDWGSHHIESIANDLQNAFPGRGGFSRANIFRIKAFYEAYEKSRTAVRQLEELPIFSVPWGHNVVLLERLENNSERLWYAQKSLVEGWSRATLESCIKTNLFHREGKAITNFTKTLLVPHSEKAQQSFKDPYFVDFLSLPDEYTEQELEKGLIDNIQKLLLEMGKGFAFVGRQHHLEVSGKDFYLDLLFYHFKLRCFVIVELKAKEFDPRDIGQLNFYLSAVDDLIKSPEDKPTIGLLLCKTKDNVIVEYALRSINKPIGVAEYTTEITKKLPKELKSSLPTIAEIETELEKQEMLAEAIKPRKKAIAKAKPKRRQSKKAKIIKK